MDAWCSSFLRWSLWQPAQLENQSSSAPAGPKGCLNGPYLYGYILHLCVCVCVFLGKMESEYFPLSVIDCSQILLCKSFRISGPRKVPGPLETSVDPACISSQLVGHRCSLSVDSVFTLPHVRGAALTGKVLELKELLY